MMNEGLWAQLKKYPVNICDKPKNRITARDIFMVCIYMWGSMTLKYSIDKITSEEQLDVALEHYQFLRKYNLL